MRLAPYIDHTLLKPTATQAEIDALCHEARAHDFASVCVAGRWVSRAAYLTTDSPVHVSAVINFPLGTMSQLSLLKEAVLALGDGAEELDMVMPMGDFFNHERKNFVRVVQSVVALGAPVKLILETGLLTPAQIEEACLLALQGGVAMVKTSTGFGPGGATLEAVQLMRRCLPETVGVKASGGIRTREFALQLIEAGATRLGTSAGLEIIKDDSDD